MNAFWSTEDKSTWTRSEDDMGGMGRLDTDMVQAIYATALVGMSVRRRCIYNELIAVIEWTDRGGQRAVDTVVVKPLFSIVMSTIA